MRTYILINIRLSSNIIFIQHLNGDQMKANMEEEAAKGEMCGQKWNLNAHMALSTGWKRRKSQRNGKYDVREEIFKWKLISIPIATYPH